MPPKEHRSSSKHESGTALSVAAGVGWITCLVNAAAMTQGHLRIGPPPSNPQLRCGGNSVGDAHDLGFLPGEHGLGGRGEGEAWITFACNYLQELRR